MPFLVFKYYAAHCQIAEIIVFITLPIGQLSCGVHISAFEGLTSCHNNNISNFSKVSFSTPSTHHLIYAQQDIIFVMAHGYLTTEQRNIAMRCASLWLLTDTIFVNQEHRRWRYVSLQTFGLSKSTLSSRIPVGS